MAHVIPELDKKGLRDFALTTGAVVGVLFGLILPWLFGFGYPRWPWIFMVVFGLWGLIAPSTLRPVYYGWMRVGLLISKVTTPLVMGIVFFGVLLPTALIMRLVGKKDSLRRSLDADAESYRVETDPYSSNDYTRPF